MVATALLLPAQIALVRLARGLLGVTPGALMPFGPMLLAIVLVLAPVCLLLGAMFTLGARLLAAEQDQGVGAAYVAESLGAVLGGALFSLLLVRWLDPFQVALLAGALNLGLAALLPASRLPGRLPRPGVRTLPAIGLACLALPLGAWLHAATLARQYPGLVFARDSIYGRIVVTTSGEQRVFYENGLFFFETQGLAAEEVAHLPLLAHPNPRRVLLIGGGVSGTLAEILRHPSVEAVHYVELDPLVVEAARAELPAGQAAVLDDARVTVAHVDGRLYVREGRAGGPFDVIILDLPEPATGQLNRFYTAEFFAEVRAVLAEGGIFALRLPWQENYPGPALQRLGASIYGALAAGFPEILPLPGERLTLLASGAPLPAEPEILRRRLAERGLDTRWVVPSYLDYLLTNDRVAQARRLLSSDPGARPNRDLEPVSTFYALAAWLSRFSGAWGRLAASAALLRMGWLAVALAGGVSVARTVAARAGPAGSLRLRVALAVGLAGLAAMTLQVVALLAFQVMHGYVYSQVGLIVTAFMGGLALGSALANRHSWPPDGRRPRMALMGILGAIALFALGFGLLVGAPLPAWIYPLLALAAGGLTGPVFPTAVACLRPAVREPGRMAGLLYGADLAGGCLGAVGTSVFLVPVLGVPQTCLAVALVGLAGVALLI